VVVRCCCVVAWRSLNCTADWSGNSSAIADRHYLHTVEPHSQRAVASGAACTLADSALQNPVQLEAVSAGNEPHRKTEPLAIAKNYEGLPFCAGISNTPKGSRTPVSAVRGRCPGPLDDGGPVALSIRDCVLADKAGGGGTRQGDKQKRRQGDARSHALRGNALPGRSCGPGAAHATRSVADTEFPRRAWERGRRPFSLRLRSDAFGQRHEGGLEVQLVFLQQCQLVAGRHEDAR
jgi:hypothetical protein